MSEVCALEIESIAAGGDGIARHQGLVVFVPRTAPGDRVVALVQQRKRLARGIVQRIERAAAGRVTAPCAHYDTDQCGGCQLQHLSLYAQHQAKRRIVADAFGRIARREVPLPEIRTDGNPWRYRSKLTLALRRTTMGWIAGLHSRDAPDRIFELRDCLISHERLLQVWREVVSASRYLPNVDRLRGTVRLLGDHSGGVAFALDGAREWGVHEAFFSRTPSLDALWWTPEGAGRRLLHDRRPVDADREPGASFTQVNPGVAMLLRAYLINAVMRHSPETVVDAYAGTGEVAIALAARGVRVTAIELDHDASAWAGARLAQRSRAVTGRVEDHLGSALPADVVVLNPPRAGVDLRVTDVLDTAVGVRSILYVSCDPATLARDVARLPGWRLASLTTFDMFPQTAHVETVCELVPDPTP